MVKKRNRTRQVTTLEERLAKFATNLRDQTNKLPPGVERAELIRKVRQTEAARRLNAVLTSGEAVTLAEYARAELAPRSNRKSAD